MVVGTVRLAVLTLNLNPYPNPAAPEDLLCQTRMVVGTVVSAALDTGDGPCGDPLHKAQQARSCNQPHTQRKGLDLLTHAARKQRRSPA